MEELVRRFGDGDLIAASTLQPGMQRFECSFGAIAYRSAWGMDVTLGGPLCAPSDRAAMIERFLRARRRPVFCYLRPAVARLLEGSGLHLAGMGVDRHVDTEALLARPPAAVRGALRHARRAGVELSPVDLRDADAALVSRLRAINERYLARAECTIEMSFINQPMRYGHDGLRRVFVLRARAETSRAPRRRGILADAADAPQNTPGIPRRADGVGDAPRPRSERLVSARALSERDAPLGFAVLNPIFTDGTVTAYLLDILRFDRTRVWGVWLSTVHALATTLAREGLGLSVGFAPLHRIQHPSGRSRMLAAQMDAMARLFASAAYLRRLRELKDAVPGAEEPRSFASPSRSALTNLLVLFEVSGVGYRTLFGPDLVKVLGEGLGLRRAA